VSLSLDYHQFIFSRMSLLSANGNKRGTSAPPDRKRPPTSQRIYDKLPSCDKVIPYGEIMRKPLNNRFKERVAK
jgi:hypothetical protein